MIKMAEGATQAPLIETLKSEMNWDIIKEIVAETQREVH